MVAILWFNQLSSEISISRAKTLGRLTETSRHDFSVLTWNYQYGIFRTYSVGFGSFERACINVFDLSVFPAGLYWSITSWKWGNPSGVLSCSLLRLKLTYKFFEVRGSISSGKFLIEIEKLIGIDLIWLKWPFLAKAVRFWALILLSKRGFDS